MFKRNKRDKTPQEPPWTKYDHCYRKVAYALHLATVPGVTVGEIRAAAGLEPLNWEEIDGMVLNLPSETDT